MKKSVVFLLISTLILVVFIVEISAQDNPGGTITYQYTTKYTFSPTGKPEWDEYAKTLPTERIFDKVLYFTPDASLFEEIAIEKEELSIKEQKAIYMANYGKAPSPQLKKLYRDLKKNKKTEHLEFMARDFLVESDLMQQGWKMTSEFKKILEYNCMGAEMNIGKNRIIAWFTPEIPVSTGPAEYSGLPGIILAVEKNDETIFLATSADLTPPGEAVLVKPNTGKKVTSEEFDRIVDEKTEEFYFSGAGKEKDYQKK